MIEFLLPINVFRSPDAVLRGTVLVNKRYKRDFVKQSITRTSYEEISDEHYGNSPISVTDDGLRYLILQREDVVEVTIITFGPGLPTGPRLASELLDYPIIVARLRPRGEAALPAGSAARRCALRADVGLRRKPVAVRTRRPPLRYCRVGRITAARCRKSRAREAASKVCPCVASFARGKHAGRLSLCVANG